MNGFIFNRESSLTIGGSWGEVTFGRLGTFFTGIGTYGQIGKMSINSCRAPTGMMAVSSIHDNRSGKQRDRLIKVTSIPI